MTAADQAAGERPLLALLEAIRQAKVDFFDALCAASASADPDVQAALRQEQVYQVAEFFYLLRAHGVVSPEAIRRLAEGNNAYLRALSRDPGKMERMGLFPERIKKAIFSEDQLGKLVENFRRTPPALDQSDLGRLLIIVMSVETSRKVCVGCAEAGFLSRVKSPYGAQLVRSNGTLERIYGEHLERLHAALARDVFGGRQ
jgi:hypothetical protein